MDHASYHLVALAVQRNLLMMRRAGCNGHFDDLCLTGHFLSLAGCALVLLVDRLSLALTHRTRLLHLLNHARSDLALHNANAPATTAGAWHACHTRLPTGAERNHNSATDSANSPLARLADDLLVQLQLGR